MGGAGTSIYMTRSNLSVREEETRTGAGLILVQDFHWRLNILTGNMVDLLLAKLEIASPLELRRKSAHLDAYGDAQG